MKPKNQLCAAVLSTCVCVALLATLPGCFLLLVGGAAAGGVAAIAYVNGELVSEEKATLDKSWDAMQAAAKALELPSTRTAKDQLVATLECRGADNTEYVLRAERIDVDRTRIKIRVGTFGDRTRSDQILAEIRKRL
ncbi:MAG: DUF3568 family protein [Planctomycetota bacterium]